MSPIYVRRDILSRIFVRRPHFVSPQSFENKGIFNLSPWTDRRISPKLLANLTDSDFTLMIQRKRGRPPGASRLNAADEKILNQMAEIIARRSMPPTTAMRQLGIGDDTTIRRLRRKWNAAGASTRPRLNPARNSNLRQERLAAPTKAGLMRMTSSRSRPFCEGSRFPLAGDSWADTTTAHGRA